MSVLLASINGQELKSYLFMTFSAFMWVYCAQETHFIASDYEDILSGNIHLLSAYFDSYLSSVS